MTVIGLDLPKPGSWAPQSRPVLVWARKLHVPWRVAGIVFTLESPESWILVTADAGRAACVWKREEQTEDCSYPGTQWKGAAHPENVPFLHRSVLSGDALTDTPVPIFTSSDNLLN